MASPSSPTITLTPTGAAVAWDGRSGRCVLDLDRVDGAQPNWIGSAADLDELADRRTGQRVIDLLTEFAEQRQETIALYHDDGRLEWLVEPDSA